MNNNDSIFAERDAAIAERDAALNRAGMYKRERDTWRREYDRVNALLAARNALSAAPRFYISRVTMNGPTGRSRPREYWHVRDRTAPSSLRYAPERVVASSPDQDTAAKICDRLNEDTL